MRAKSGQISVVDDQGFHCLGGPVVEHLNKGQALQVVGFLEGNCSGYAMVAVKTLLN